MPARQCQSLAGRRDICGQVAFSFMKNKLLIILISAFILSISFNFNIAKAQESTTSEASGAATTQEKKIEYELPFPGILPDSPLYFLKVTRDRVVSILISDPMKKAEFDLLQSEKRLKAGVALLGKKKNDLGISTIHKGQNYFEEALGEIVKARGQGFEVSSFSNRLLLSSQKQVDVLKEYKNIKDLAPVMERAVNIEKKAKALN